MPWMPQLLPFKPINLYSNFLPEISVPSITGNGLLAAKGSLPHRWNVNLLIVRYEFLHYIGYLDRSLCFIRIFNSMFCWYVSTKHSWQWIHQPEAINPSMTDTTILNTLTEPLTTLVTRAYPDETVRHAIPRCCSWADVFVNLSTGVGHTLHYSPQENCLFTIPGMLFVLCTGGCLFRTQLKSQTEAQTTILTATD